MIISLNEALDHAERNSSALAAINTPFFEALLAAIDVGEATGVPIILQHAEVHESITAIEEIGPAMVELAKRSSAPFVLHVDHAESIDYVRRGIEIGFNSAMIDASQLPYEDNVRITREVVEMASERGIGVEGEIGMMTGNENGDPSQGIADESLYTDPQQAADFVRETGLSCLAASFGTVHGMYRQEPNMNYELIAELRERTGVPIVMHGGSGLTADEYRGAINHGVRKINYYTYAAKAAHDAVKPLMADENIILFSNLAVAARAAVRDDLTNFVDILTNKGAS